MLGQTKAVGTAAAMVMLAGLAVSSASGGVEEIVWVEVDNAVGTIGNAEGAPTGLDGVRTFDLYAVVTPDTRVWAADFGYVGINRGFDDNMWTTQSVYQHGLGGDTQSPAVGIAPTLAAMEFDTYVGLGMLDSQIVMNATIISGEWSPSMFRVAWFGAQYSADFWMPATGDGMGRLFLARISVDSAGGFGDLTGDTEWLGGRVFLSGEDDTGPFGQQYPLTGLFIAPNAFHDEVSLLAAAEEQAGLGEDEADASLESVVGDFNSDGAVDGKDLLILQVSLGATDAQFDLNNDGIVDALDMARLLEIIQRPGGFLGADGDDDPMAGLTPKERKKVDKQRRKAQKQRAKAERKAAKQATKARKRQEMQRRKDEKRREKERKKREKQAR